MNLENKLTCGIMVVMIGRKACIDPMFRYFRDVKIPLEFKHLNLYVVKAWNSEFDSLFKEKIKEYNLKNKFKKIKTIKGVPKVNNHFNWDDWEKSSRVLTPFQKHESTAQNLHKGIKKVVSEVDLVHIVDDDTIPPLNTLNSLWDTLTPNDSYGITSGFYFDKGWIPADIIKGKQESVRKLVVSVEKDKWHTSTLDDFINVRQEEVGFVGNGCMLTYSYLLKNVLPLADKELNSKEGPDITISKRIRDQGKKIIMVPTVFCKHLDEKGNEVGLTQKHFKKLIKTKSTTKSAIIFHERKINYEILASQFDKVYVFINTDSFYNNRKYIIKHMQMAEKIPNIKIIKTSTSQYRNLYKHYKGHIVNIKYRILLEKAYELINLTTDYDITVFKRIFEPYNCSQIYSFNYKNLKNYLTQN